MYKNGYLENCINNNEGSRYLVRGYNFTTKNKLDELVIEELTFIYTDKHTNDLTQFKDELMKADIKEFILTDNGSGLLDILHGLNSVNIKVKDLVKFDYRDKWDDMHTLKGIRMSVEV